MDWQSARGNVANGGAMSGAAAPSQPRFWLRNRYIQLGLTLFLLPAAIIAVVTNPAPRTIAAALIFVVGIGWSVWAEHWRRGPEHVVDPSAPAPELQKKLHDLRVEFRKAGSGVLFFPFGILIAAFLKFTALTGYPLSDFFPLLAHLAVRNPMTTLAFGIMFAVMLYFGVRAMLIYRELKRLRASLPR